MSMKRTKKMASIASTFSDLNIELDFQFYDLNKMNYTVEPTRCFLLEIESLTV